MAASNATGAQIGEPRLLIDGELTEATSGARFDNVNPATEEVLGGTADASVDDMRRAIGAARRAFDETDWSTNRALRKRCLRAAAGRARGREGGPAGRARRRGRDPDPHHLRAAARRAAGGRPDVAGRDHRHVRVGARPARRPRVHVQQPPQGREGARRRRRRHHPVELPVRGHDPEGRPGPRDGQHDDREARARHAVERYASRSARRRAHRHPRRRVQRRRVLGPPRRRGARARPPRRPDLVHRARP